MMLIIIIPSKSIPSVYIVPGVVTWSSLKGMWRGVEGKCVYAVVITN